MGFCASSEQLEGIGLNNGDSFIKEKKISLDKFVKDNQESFHFKLDEKFESNGGLKLINVCNMMSKVMLLEIQLMILKRFMNTMVLIT